MTDFHFRVLAPAVSITKTATIKAIRELEMPIITAKLGRRDGERVVGGAGVDMVFVYISQVLAFPDGRMSFLRPDAGRVNQPIGIRARGFLDKSAAGILPRSKQTIPT